MTLRALSVEGFAPGVTSQSLTHLDVQFDRRERPGVAIATQASRIATPAERVEALCGAYTSQLLDVAPATAAEDGDRSGEWGGQL